MNSKAQGHASQSNVDGTAQEPHRASGINDFYARFPASLREYMQGFAKRQRLTELGPLLDRMQDLKVCVIGDTILDDYHFCRTLGASSKEASLALQFESSELFAGGVLAVANHVANFAAEVNLISRIGERDSHLEFIEAKLHPRVRSYFTVQKGAPTILKRRFIDGYFVSKLLEVYVMDDRGPDAAEEAELLKRVRTCAEGCDLILAADFGHGTISPQLRTKLEEVAPFLAVNTQANAGNRGFHTIGGYTRADYVSLSEGELRLETRDMRGELAPMLTSTGSRLGAANMIVTRGHRGCIVRSSDGELCSVPSFTPRVLDRVGAGDALFSITALAAYLGAAPELIGFIGNVVGGLAVEILGNKRSIDRREVERFIEPLIADLNGKAPTRPHQQSQEEELLA